MNYVCVARAPALDTHHQLSVAKHQLKTHALTAPTRVARRTQVLRTLASGMASWVPSLRASTSSKQQLWAGAAAGRARRV